ncbi:M4 family metallopeptidase [Nannocystis punicea]|uniref:M4 family metallopeptidase n=1 Tax=Nannocystis punicea TaxID=2995304 RepID=A0ABY7GW26_9BACT|nr:M4 family metallopeptidase [Nannocystis poenicansa]WAS91158.1 M4 family metallopeptidase [Nannocystis poenicansa]
MLRTAGVVSSIVSCFLLSACYEGGGAAGDEVSTAERIVTAEDLEGLGAGGVLELDLGAEAVRFSFAAGPIDFARVVVVGEDGRRALLQDLLARRGEAWGVIPARLELGDSFLVDAKMVADAAKERPTTLMVAQEAALSRLPRIDQVVTAGDGVPSLVAGDLGFLPKGEPRAAAQTFLQDVAPVFRMHAATDLEPLRVKSDDRGQVHVKFQQYLHELPVIGGELTVHADGVSGRVHAVSGRFIAGEDVASEPEVEGEAALATALAGLPADAASTDAPDLVYVVTEDSVALAWMAEVTYTSADGPERDLVFADARTGELVTRHPQHHRALARKVYDAKKGENLPGTEIANPGSSADLSVKDAFNYAGTTYNFYKDRFGRDSFNGAGATIHSTVHFSVGYDNAFWNGQQMVYGDGSGQYFSSLARDLDIVSHELTHAVTQYEANLVYQNQSGALNEAFSDIMAASVQAHLAGGVVSAATWKLAEASFTPNTSGDAMRYMDDPMKDGQSYDYWPTRYQGGQDNGGVHINSGIANLAFKLLVTGGVHPRGKTANNVTGIGITKASKIFYDALVTYLSANATFQDARNATAQAATAIHGAGSAEVAAVHAAWTAVGVPGDPGSGGGGGGGSCTGTQYQGSLSGAGAQQAQPNGSYYQTTGTKTHTACLTGPNGTDFDLYLLKWNGSTWAQVAQSESPTSSESISYVGTAGYYTYTVASYAGAGNYTLTAGVQ